MKPVARILGTTAWAATLGVSYFLVQFATEHLSHWMASRYVYGPSHGLDARVTFLGLGAFLAAFLLIPPATRWHAFGSGNRRG